MASAGTVSVTVSGKGAVMKEVPSRDSPFTSNISLATAVPRAASSSDASIERGGSIMMGMMMMARKGANPCEY